MPRRRSRVAFLARRWYIWGWRTGRILIRAVIWAAVRIGCNRVRHVFLPFVTSFHETSQESLISSRDMNGVFRICFRLAWSRFGPIISSPSCGLWQFRRAGNPIAASCPIRPRVICGIRTIGLWGGALELPVEGWNLRLCYLGQRLRME